MRRTILILVIIFLTTTGKSFAQKGLSFGLSVDYSNNYLKVDKQNSSGMNLKSTSDWMFKGQLKFNYDITKRFYLSSGIGIHKERIAGNWYKPYIPYSEINNKNFHVDVFSENLRPNFFLPISIGYKVGNEKKCMFTVEAGLMASLSGGNFGKPIASGSQHFSHSYQEGDSVYLERWYSNYTYVKPIAINLISKIGITFTSKRESVFDIHLLISKGLIKTITGDLKYFSKASSTIDYLSFIYTNPTPNETYNFFNRGSQYGLGISYMINWNELKKNKRLEKEYENQEGK